MKTVRHCILFAFTLTLPVVHLCAQSESERSSNRIISTDYNECMTGVKDTLGNWIIAPKYEYISRIGRSDFYVKQFSQAGVIDSVGNIIVPLAYTRITASYIDEQEFYTVQKDKKYGVVRRDGKMIVPVKYKWVNELNDTSFAACGRGVKWHLYNRNGDLIDSPWMYGQAPQPMGDGFYRVEQLYNPFGTKYGVMDSKGNKVLPRRYHGISRCMGYDAYEVKKRRHQGYVDLQGNELWPLCFDTYFFRHSNWGNWSTSDFTFSHDSIGIGSINGKEGLFTLKGDTILPFIYDNIYRLTGGNLAIFKIELNERFGIYEIGKGWIVEPTVENMYIANYWYTDSDSSYVALFIGEVNGKAGLQTTRGDVIVPFGYDFYTYMGPELRFIARDSIVQVHFTTSQTRSNLIAGIDTFTQRNLTAENNYAHDFIPDNGKFSVHTAPDGSRMFYHPGHLKDTLFQPHDDELIPARMNPVQQSEYPNEIVNASAFEIHTYYPKFRLPDSAGYFYEYRDSVHSVDPVYERMVIYEYTNRYGTKQLARDYVYNSISDKSHTYYVTRDEMLFREDGKILVQRDKYYSISNVQDRVDSTVTFILRGIHGEMVIDSQGDTVVPLQRNREIGEFTNDYAWINFTPNKRKSTWKVINNHTGAVVFGNKNPLRYEGSLVGNTVSYYGVKTGWMIFNLTDQKYIASGLNHADALDDSAKVFLVRTCIGHLGLMDNQGRYVSDTTWKYYTPFQVRGGLNGSYSYWYSSTSNSFPLSTYFNYIILYNDTSSAVYDTRTCRLNQDGKSIAHQAIFVSDTNITVNQIGPQIYRRFGYFAGRFAIVVSPADSSKIQPWHEQCLFDSIFTRRRINDYWNENDRKYRGYSYSSFTSCYYCQKKSKATTYQPTPNDMLSGGYYQVHYVGDSVMSFMTTGYNGATRFISNTMLTENGPQVLMLDSLFNPATDWRNFIINTVITYVNTHLYVEGDCHNPAALPIMLRQRFMISENGLELYPDQFYENDKQLVITLPWKDVDPYLRADMKTKLPAY